MKGLRKSSVADWIESPHRPSDKSVKNRPSGFQFAAIAAFRCELRRFLAFSEAAAAEVGLPPQQHQALLAIAGHVENDPPNVGTLFQQLMIAPHAAAELVARMVDAGLIRKTPAASDRRRREPTLTPESDALLHRLTTVH